MTVYKELAGPVWICHGVRGDFVDYGKTRELANRANWKIQVLRTGALPQFERLDQVTASYDAFIDRLA